LLGLVFAIIETGLTFLFGLSLENATQQLARMMQTGQVQQLGVSSADDLKSKVICPAGGSGLLPSFVDCSRLVVDVRSAAAYASDGSMSFYKESPQYCPGSGGQVLVLRLAYGMPVFLPALALGNSVFGPSTSGIVDDFPNALGWTHLLADAVVFEVESSGDSGGGAPASSASSC
jgi:Flp pilus assembly protein TadG